MSVKILQLYLKQTHHKFVFIFFPKMLGLKMENEDLSIKI